MHAKRVRISAHALLLREVAGVLCHIFTVTHTHLKCALFYYAVRQTARDCTRDGTHPLNCMNMSAPLRRDVCACTSLVYIAHSRWACLRVAHRVKLCEFVVCRFGALRVCLYT